MKTIISAATLAGSFLRRAKCILPSVILIAAGAGCLTHVPRSKWDAGTQSLGLRTDTATFTINANGAVSQIVAAGTGKNYLPAAEPAPLLQLNIAGAWQVPDQAAWDAKLGRLTLHYKDAAATAVVQVEAKPTHLVFELLGLQSSQPVELVLWGPYPTTIGDIIGEVVGVVRDPEFAVGIQSLNAKTLGGSPAHADDAENGSTAEDAGHYPNLPAELNREQSFRGDTARRTAFGSSLQCYCRNRDQDRLIANWGHEKYLAPAWPDGGVTGSKIALFAGPASQALNRIAAIEVAEGLPHPMLHGVWAKQSPGATASYLIVDFSESTIDRAIEMTRRAGLQYLYHSSPFETWGHFALKKQLFPDQETYAREEQRRFEILDAHWDLPLKAVDLEK